MEGVYYQGYTNRLVVMPGYDSLRREVWEAWLCLCCSLFVGQSVLVDFE